MLTVDLKKVAQKKAEIHGLLNAMGCTRLMGKFKILILSILGLKRVNKISYSDL